jgi:hypothetical protein
MIEQLSKATKESEEATLRARQELMEKEKLIREESVKKASEDFNTKLREQEETISRLREQLTTAKQVAEQGSQQQQGEVLELEIENALIGAFPFDTIEEVKKGERGCDVLQTVNDRTIQNCGLILWECKNAKTYAGNWLTKLRDEIAEKKAQAGVIVFNSPDAGKDFEQLAENVWLVRPRHALMVAAFLRDACIKIAIANLNAEGKDLKMDMLYNYLTSTEFSNRIRYIIESYDEMAKQLTKEKKQAQKRWAAQEKILEKVTTSLYGLSGDLCGIAGQNIIALPELDGGDEDDDEE